MLKYVKELKRKAEAGDKEAKQKIDKIMECLATMDEYRVANCIILMKELIPELENQIAILIKKFVVDKKKDLSKLSREERELIEFLRNNLKE